MTETFLVAWRRLDAIPDDPIPWLLRVARNVISNQERSSRRRDALTAKLAMVHPVHRPGMADPSDEIGSKEAVFAVLASLPPAEREAMLLVAWEDLDVKTAASILGCSTSALTVRLHRARKRLRKELGDVGLLGVRRPANQAALEEGEAR